VNGRKQRIGEPARLILDQRDARALLQRRERWLVGYIQLRTIDRARKNDCTHPRCHYLKRVVVATAMRIGGYTLATVANNIFLV
jgi:hypothetical protein